jgi:hypothetical protein
LPDERLVKDAFVVGVGKLEAILVAGSAPFIRGSAPEFRSENRAVLEQGLVSIVVWNLSPLIRIRWIKSVGITVKSRQLDGA